MKYPVRPAVLSNIETPRPDAAYPVPLTDDTMRERLGKVLDRMEKHALDTLVIYCDLEHSANFAYLTGFVTRFEEALLVLSGRGEAALIVGNENLKLAPHSLLPARVLHCPYFSLPDQPMDGEKPLSELLMAAGVPKNGRVGLVGWKLLRSSLGDTSRWFDLPAYIVDAVGKAVGNGHIENATDLMIGPEGARVRNNANEIAHYEYGSALSSDCVMRTMDALAPGKTELELGSLMNACGQRCNVVTICASGPRYDRGNLYPTPRRLRAGDAMSLTCGYPGGLSSRAGILAEDESQIPESCADYLTALAVPYFSALAAWLENIRIGMTGGELYAVVEEALPRERFGWGLCPGHLTADEEWLCSPIRCGSVETLQSGMLLQTDIIPSLKGYPGAGCENGVVLADAHLRAEIKAQYPALFSRMQQRRSFVTDRLGIRLPEEVLPLCSGLAYFRPYLLRRGTAMRLADPPA